MNRAIMLGSSVLLLAALGWGLASSATTKEPASGFVDGGDGAQTVVEEGRVLGLEVQRLASSPTALGRGVASDPRHSLLVVFRPGEPYTAAEADAIAGWVARGGHLLVADDFGQAHTLTSQFGISFERVRVVAGPGDWEASVDRASLRLAPVEPSALQLQPGLEATLLASSPPDSFIDRDGDGIIGPADPRGTFPFGVRIDHGAGSVTAFADADLLSAQGALDAGNRAFVAALIGEALPDGGTILVDESRAVSDPVLGLASKALSAAGSSGWRLALMALFVLLLAALLVPAAFLHWQPHRFRPNRFRRRSDLHALEDGRAGMEPLLPGGWTSRGSAAALLAAALSIGALLWGSQQAAVAGAALLTALGLAAAARVPALVGSRKVSATRLDEGGELDVELRIDSGGANAAAIEFQDRLPETFQLSDGTNWFQASARPGHAVQARFRCSPALRGPHSLGPLLARAPDPLGLRVDQATVVPTMQVSINPRRESVRNLPFGTRIPTTTLGPHLVNRAGDGSEFHSLRGYQAGDSFRSVNWKASARSGKGLMVNQRVHESMTRLALFLDARAISGAGPASQTPLAHGCRAVLSVAAGALRMRDRIRVVIYSDGVRELPSQPGSRQLHDLTELLSGLHPTGTTTFQEALTQVLPTLRNGSPILVVSGLEDDPSIVEGLRTARSHGLQPVVVASPLGLQPVEEEDEGEPAAAEIAARRARTVASIQALGIPVYDAVTNVPLDLLFRTGGT